MHTYIQQSKRKELKMKIQVYVLMIHLCGGNIPWDVEEIRMRDKSVPIVGTIIVPLLYFSVVYMCVALGVNRSFSTRRGLRYSYGTLRHNRLLRMVNARLTRSDSKLQSSATDNALRATDVP